MRLPCMLYGILDFCKGVCYTAKKGSVFCAKPHKIKKYFIQKSQNKGEQVWILFILLL